MAPPIPQWGIAEYGLRRGYVLTATGSCEHTPRAFGYGALCAAYAKR